MYDKPYLAPSTIRDEFMTYYTSSRAVPMDLDLEAMELQWVKNLYYLDRKIGG